MQERAKYQGLMMAIVGLGVVAGPVIGGTVSEKASWRLVSARLFPSVPSH